MADINDFLDILRRADAGEVPIEMANREHFLKDEYFNNPVFLVAGWRFAVFNDCGEWDYIEEVIAPDGMRFVYSSDAPPPGWSWKELPGAVADWTPENLSRWGLEAWEN